MKPYHRLTIIRNRFRASDLRAFRLRVQRYFEQLEYLADDQLADREAVQSARAAINRMIPRILQIVHAANLGGSAALLSRGPVTRAIEIIQDILHPRYAHGAHEEVLDVLDMTLGVYDADQYAAWLRTINPFHHIATALGFLAGLPRRALVAIGLLRPRVEGSRPEDVSRLEAALSRLAAMEHLLERTVTELREMQSRGGSQGGPEVMELAERIDFLERVLTQQRQLPQFLPGEKKQVTPV